MMLRPFGHPVACCCVSLGVVTQSLKPAKFFSQQLPTFLTFRDRRSVAQQCWIRLPSSFQHCWDHAGALHMPWSSKSYGLYPSHHALQVPTLLGVVASVCTPLQTRTQQFPTLLVQQCWEFLHAFANHCKHGRNNSQHCWPNNVESLYVALRDYEQLHRCS